MMHSERVWSVKQVESGEELARMLTDTTWCGCTGFRLGNYVFLNDSTSPDALQEFAIVEPKPNGSWWQIESITFSWCTYEEALDHIRKSLAGEYSDGILGAVVAPVIQTPEEHKSCPLCA